MQKIAGEYVTNSEGLSTAQPESITFAGHMLGDSAEQAAAKAQYKAIGDETALTRLPGSYVSVVHRPDSLSLIADTSGQFPLYYTEQGGLLRYNTDIGSLASATGGKPDRVAIAAMIIRASGLVPTQTEYQDVRRIPAGHALQISSSGTVFSEYESFAPDETANYGQAIEELRETLKLAVGRRMQTPGTKGADFSGGFDSTSLAFLAARYIPPGEQLDAFHYKHGVAFNGDLSYARRYAALDTRLRLRDNTIAADILPYDVALTGNVWGQHDVLDGYATTINRTMARYKQIAEAGVETHLVGEGADMLFSPNPHYIADLIRRGPVRNASRILSDVTFLAQMGYASPVKALGFMGKVAKLTIEDSWDILAQRLEGTSRLRPLWHTIDTQGLELLQQDVRNNLAEIVRSNPPSSQNPAHGLADFLTMREAQTSGASVATLRNLVAVHGVDIHAPFLDHNVMRACLQVGTHLRARSGQFKPMLRDALIGLVPSEVFARNTKGSYNDEEYRGLAKHGNTLRQLFGRSSRLVDLGIIDPVRMQQAITRAELGLEVPFGAISSAVTAELWLRNTQHAIAPDGQYIAPASPQLPDRMPELAAEPLHVPNSVRFVKDRVGVGVVSYNLATEKSWNMHRKASTVIEALQARGNVYDALNALQDMYPSVPANTLSNDLAIIIQNLKQQDVLQPGDYRPYAITPMVTPMNDSQAEVLMMRGKLDISETRPSDYIRMGRALLAATKQVQQYSLYDLVTSLQGLKADLPYSTEERVHRLMTAGHVLNRLYARRAACVEFTAATILAEAASGRRVDFSLGIAPYPRSFHAWPVVNGNPVQTNYDEVVNGKFTPFGVW